MEFFRSAQKIPKTLQIMKNTLNDPNLKLGFRNYTVIVAKFRVEWLSDLGV